MHDRLEELARLLITGGSMLPEYHRHWKRFHSQLAERAGEGIDYRQPAIDVLREKGTIMSTREVLTELGMTINPIFQEEIGRALSSHTSVKATFDVAKAMQYQFIA